jgi:hypothetical protein
MEYWKNEYASSIDLFPAEYAPRASISDLQQSIAAAPSTGLPHPLLVVADLKICLATPRRMDLAPSTAHFQEN